MQEDGFILFPLHYVQNVALFKHWAQLLSHGLQNSNPLSYFPVGQKQSGEFNLSPRHS